MGNSNEERHYPSYAHWIACAKALGHPSVDDALLALYLQQISLPVISRKFSTREGIIRNHLRRLLPQENKFYKRYQKLYLKITSLGYSSVDQFLIDHKQIPPTKISILLGIHAATVRNHFHRLGLKVNTPGGANNPKGGKIKHYYKGTPLKNWCQKNGMDYTFIMHRVNKGWNLEKAIFTPKLKQGRPRL